MPLYFSFAWQLGLGWLAEVRGDGWHVLGALGVLVGFDSGLLLIVLLETGLDELFVGLFESFLLLLTQDLLAFIRQRQIEISYVNTIQPGL